MKTTTLGMVASISVLSALTFTTIVHSDSRISNTSHPEDAHLALLDTGESARAMIPKLRNFTKEQLGSMRITRVGVCSARGCNPKDLVFELLQENKRLAVELEGCNGKD